MKRSFQGLLGTMSRCREHAGDLAPAVDHFLKVTRSYWAGLFHCYDVHDLPRTNNELERYFGSARYHERRASGRKTASPAMVVRGEVRVVASVATRLNRFDSKSLRLSDVERWKELREKLDQRRETRRAQTRFRRDPKGFLRRLESRIIKPRLPP